MSKCFHIFKKLQRGKNLVSTLINIQALLTGGIMAEETDSRSNFNSIPFYQLCLKITTHSIYEVFLLRMRVECPNSTFNRVTGQPSKSFDISNVYRCHYFDAGVDKQLGGNVPCTNKARKILLLIMYIAFFKDNYIFVNNFNTSSRSYKPIPGNYKDKI